MKTHRRNDGPMDTYEFKLVRVGHALWAMMKQDRARNGGYLPQGDPIYAALETVWRLKREYRAGQDAKRQAESVRLRQRFAAAAGLLFALLLFPGALRATTPVSGSMKDLGTAAITANSFIRFTLRGCGGNQPIVPGVAVLAGPGQPYFKDFAADASGNVSGTLYSTRDAAGTGNGEIECGTSFTADWYGMTVYVGGKGGPEVPVHARNGVSLDPGTVTPITVNPVVTSPTGDSTYARLDSGNMPFSGNVTAPRLISTVATGTAPLGVTSTTVVPNLNAQLHGGLAAPASAIVGLTDAQALTNKTLTGPTITNPSTTGTDSGAETLASKTLTSPVINGASTGTGVQGTDASLLTAGTVSASTGVALCTDASHGATTSGCTPGGVSEGFISFNAFGGGTGSIAEELFGRVLIPSNHTLIRFTTALVLTGSGCGTLAVVTLWDNTAGSAVTGTSFTLSNGTSFFDTGAISQSLVGGHTYDVKVTTASATCGTAPSLGNIQAIYQ